jgi:threonine dehydrogenase-like Zn-dependent dehydrogenase
MGAAEHDPRWRTTDRIIGQGEGMDGGAFCDRVIEAVGKQWPLDLAAELTRERGR